MRRRAGTEKQRNRPKKRAPAGPAKRAAKKLPERRAMIAAPRRRAGSPKKGLGGLVRKATWRVDRLANRGLEAVYSPLHALLAWLLLQWRRLVRLTGPPLRAAAAPLFPLLARGERLFRRLA